MNFFSNGRLELLLYIKTKVICCGTGHPFRNEILICNILDESVCGSIVLLPVCLDACPSLLPDSTVKSNYLYRTMLAWYMAIEDHWKGTLHSSLHGSRHVGGARKLFVTEVTTILSN